MPSVSGGGCEEVAGVLLCQLDSGDGEFHSSVCDCLAPHEGLCTFLDCRDMWQRGGRMGRRGGYLCHQEHQPLPQKRAVGLVPETGMEPPWAALHWSGRTPGCWG